MENDKLLNFLEKGGFLFEQKCAEVFKENGFSIQSGLHYLDEKESKYREVDIIATKGFYNTDTKFSFIIGLIIECKAHIAPLIALGENKDYNNNDIFPNLISTNNSSTLIEKLIAEDNIEDSIFGASKNEGYYDNIIDYNTSKDKNLLRKNRIYEAMTKSLNASLFLRDEANKSQMRICSFYIPVSIFDNSIYVFNDNIKSPNFKKVNYIKAAKFHAFDNTNPLKKFHLVSKDGIEDYAKKTISDISKILVKYMDDINLIGSNTPINHNPKYDGKY